MAEACGTLGIAVHSDEEFEPALRRALEAGRPALLHLALAPRWSTPAAGFAEIEIEPEVEVVGLEADLEPGRTASEAEPAAAAEAEAETEPREVEVVPEAIVEAELEAEPEAEPMAATDSDATSESD